MTKDIGADDKKWYFTREKTMNGKARKNYKKAKRFVLIVLLLLIGYELTVNRVHIKYVKNRQCTF